MRLLKQSAAEQKKTSSEKWAVGSGNVRELLNRLERGEVNNNNSNKQD